MRKLSGGLAGQILQGLNREMKFDRIEKGHDRHANTIPDYLQRQDIIKSCEYWGNGSSSKTYAGLRVRFRFPRDDGISILTGPRRT